jgi:hypothetical protein
MLSEEKMNRFMIILTCTILIGGLYYERSKFSKRMKKRQQNKELKVAKKTPSVKKKPKTRVASSSTSSHFKNSSFGKSFKSSKTFNWSGDMALKSSKFSNASSKASKTAQTSRQSSDQKADASGQEFLDSTKEMQKNPGLSSSVKAFKNYAKYIEDESSR